MGLQFGFKIQLGESQKKSKINQNDSKQLSNDKQIEYKQKKYITKKA